MATQTKADTAAKPTAPKKPPVPAAKRISEQLKRAAVGNKVTKDELESIAKLANALTTFIA